MSDSTRVESPFNSLCKVKLLLGIAMLWLG
jgi:hypothetical protein